MSGTLGHSGGARPGRAGRHATRFILEIGDEVDVMVGEIKTKADGGLLPPHFGGGSGIPAGVAEKAP